VPKEYPSIQAALDAALPARSADSVRVIVSAGCPPGDVRIRKPVTIEGSNGSTILPVVEGNLIIDLGGEHATIQKLEVRGSISVFVGEPHITGCTLQGNFSSSDKPLLSVTGSGAQPWIEGNTICRGSGPGVVFKNGAGGTFRQNSVAGNQAAGLEIRDFGTRPTVEGNRIEENAQHGILLHSGASGTMIGNEVHRNKLCGIVLHADIGSGLVVKGNRVHENEEGGIISEGSIKGSGGTREIIDNEELGPARDVAQID
jgi:parallel beta-helix repeat protein